MTENTDTPDPALLIKRSRGAQLRALVLGWATNETYQRALQEQAQALHEEELEISEDWGEMADIILKQFVASQND